MNNPSAVPPFLQCLAALVVMTEAFFIVGWHTRRADRVNSRAGTLVAFYLGLWLAAAFLLGDSAHFPLRSEALRLPLSGLVSLVPLIGAVLWFVYSKQGRAVGAAATPASLVAVQAYRMAGVLFLFPNFWYGVLPAGFAWPAGVGDFLTGLAAPFVASYLSRGRPGSVALAVAWNVFGILDLIVAPTMATLLHVPILAMYPLAIVPLFLGPPMGILLHVLSLRSLAARRA